MTMLPIDGPYRATVFHRGSTATAHPTMRDAFAWVKERVGSDPEKSGRVTLGWSVLLEYTAQTTEWHGDGYERWEKSR